MDMQHIDILYVKYVCMYLCKFFVRICVCMFV